MILIVCVDDKLGMMFNKRRQSRDKEVISDIFEMCGNRKIWMNDYSAKLFETEPKRITADEDFIEKTGENEFCFIENQSVAEFAGRVEAIVLYRWNRRYPADVYFDIDLNGWELTESKEFKGSSHEKITKEIYRMKKEK